MEEALRVHLISACRAVVASCHVKGPEGDESPPVVACARHKAVAVDAELDTLASNELAVLAQLDATRDAAIAVGCIAADVYVVLDARIAEVRTAAALKRAALQTEAVAVDAALEEAQAAVAAITEAAESLGDDDLAAQAPALLAREAAAHAAVAAIPVTPATSGFLGLTAAPDAPGVCLAEARFGHVLVAPVLAPHTHTPHCEADCAIRFAPHVHSVACNHARAPMGAVWAAAKSGNVAALEAALSAGGSTEEANAMSRTALLSAAGNGDVEGMRVLIAAGADVTAKSAGAVTPLHWVAQGGFAAAVALLLADPRVDMNAKNGQGLTPILAAVCSRHASHVTVPVVRLLRADPRVDVGATDDKGRSALEIARVLDEAELVELLEGREPGVAAADDEEPALEEEAGEGQPPE